MRQVTLRLALLGSIAAAGPALTEPVIRMGVRVDARPFAWQDAANQSYLGFLVDICTDAVTRAKYPFEQVPINPADRIEVLEGRRSDLDLLCDPTTVSLKRLDDFAAMSGPEAPSFSPIVFVANGTFATNRAEHSGEMDADAGACQINPSVPVANDDDETGAPPSLAAGYVIGASIEPVLRDAIASGMPGLAAGQTVCAVPQDTHVDAARAFCEGRLRFYFGDIDIIRESVAAEAERSGKSCAFDPAPVPLTYEPYAFVVTGRTPGFRAHFLKGLYEVFHHGTVEDRFRGHFEGFEMSPFLETLFRINRVPSGQPASAKVETEGESSGERTDRESEQRHAGEKQ